VSRQSNYLESPDVVAATWPCICLLLSGGRIKHCTATRPVCPCI